MQANTLFALSMLFWTASALAQDSLDFGERMSMISLATWVWAGGILAGGVLFRFALDVRSGVFEPSVRYAWPTAATCVISGFLALGVTEWYIGNGRSLHPFIQVGAIIAASINHNVVLDGVKGFIRRWIDGRPVQ